MQVLVTFRHMDPSEALKNLATEKVMRIKKYLDGASDAHVVFSVDKYMHKAEVTIPFQGIMIHAEEVSADMYHSVDRAVDKMEKQVKRYRNKLLKHRSREGIKRKIYLKTLEQVTAQDTETVSDLPPTIVEAKDLEVRPMMLDEAVMNMDLMNNDVLVFLNSKTDHVNVLYRKADHKYGLIETHSA